MTALTAQEIQRVVRRVTRLVFTRGQCDGPHGGLVIHALRLRIGDRDLCRGCVDALYESAERGGR